MHVPRGRPRLTPERYQERLSAYCAQYGVAPLDTGLPPFPTGQRETPQHSEWMSLYKAHTRLARRSASVEDRRALLDAQAGRCPICAAEVDLRDSADYSSDGGSVRAILHQRCNQLAGIAEALGPKAIDRVRAYLWPGTGKGSR